jgi:hypothetical protein
MSLLEEPVNKAVRDLITAIVNPVFPLTSIKADQPGTRPAGMYSTVKTMTTINPGWDQAVRVDSGAEDVESTLEGLRYIGLSINFFRGSSRDAAVLFQQGIQRHITSQTLWGLGLGLLSWTEVRDLTALVDAAQESRSQLDLVLNAVSTDQEIIEAILTSDIVGTYDNQAKQYDLTTEVRNTP